MNTAILTTGENESANNTPTPSPENKMIVPLNDIVEVCIYITNTN